MATSLTPSPTADGSSRHARRVPGSLRLLGRAAATGRGRVGLVLVGFVLAVAVMGPFVAPHSPTVFVASPFASHSAKLWLGADGLGRDALSRVLAGGLTILILAAIATAAGVAAGALLGVMAGYGKGFVDEMIMRPLDVALAFPQIILVLLLVSIIGPKLWLICLAVAAIHAPQVARVARSATLRVAEEDFVKFTEAIGLPRWRIILSEIVPNITGPLLVESGLRLTYSITLIAGLSFLGFGLQPPAADWGLMINENRIGLIANPWPVLVPVMLIAMLTIGMNLYTDAIARVALGAEGVVRAEPMAMPIAEPLLSPTAGPPGGQEPKED